MASLSLVVCTLFRSLSLLLSGSCGGCKHRRSSGIGAALIPYAELDADLVLNCCAATAYVNADCLIREFCEVVVSVFCYAACVCVFLCDFVCV